MRCAGRSWPLRRTDVVDLEFVRADQRLDMVSTSPAGPGFELWALSPSNEALGDALKEFARHAAVSGDRSSPFRGPSGTRAPSSCTYGLAARLLLGADLESDPSDGRGWRAIVQSSGRPTEPAHYVKIPHHGSVDAHDETMWTELVVETPHGGVTPFRAGRTSLPRDTDIDRIAKRSPNIWLTRSGATASPPRRPSAVERTLRGAVRSIEVVSVDPGRVTMRCPAKRPGEWTIDAPQPARRLQLQLPS